MLNSACALALCRGTSAAMRALPDNSGAVGEIATIDIAKPLSAI
jgi:hypothetical protein